MHPRAICPCHELRTVAPLGLANLSALFFGGYKRAVNETFAQIKPVSVMQVSGLTYYLFSLTWCDLGTIYSQ